MTVPTFRELSPEECEALLAVNHVGRLAFTFKDRPDIEPIHYVFDNGWIFGRTTQGTKLTTIGHHPYVAFEVDEVRGTFDWRSVVALGTVYLLDPEFGTANAAEYARAVELMRRFMPETLAAGDPVPFRTVMFGIHVDELRGREATPGRRRRTQRERAAK
ncbi:MAG: pyridoxamine 5'-phosphate oxidase family protein [Gemmatimonadota bacterium]|nr:pyridoxamine 5'-phosphate oxidase family protein [Gemmatimonadota bacterium]MDE3127936.1 pyridoxamine 5'-phosphate oxidase family protein [Gemmatimonadota bacterium]MDE3172563.1 pyridoxamine 5'-phosphate oxidase family protein [Gemmatimonadota bacterium]MDE3216954.1 pyridoxamine 5'-phosphate oxidase family protein [Gemmatimonadota bacterium]